MEIVIYIAAAVCTYLFTAINPAILMSKAIYKKDIRECGSGNPGFTNFKRTFGNKWAWWVLVFDLGKAAVAVAVFAWLFSIYVGSYQLGAAYTGIFAMLGHNYPIWYKFKGGKGFLVYMSVIWFISWQAGLVALVLMITLLLTTKYMSLATVVAMLTCPITLIILSYEVPVTVLCAVSVLFMAWRHRENFKRLANGTENKFSLKGKKKEQ